MQLLIYLIYSLNLNNILIYLMQKDYLILKRLIGAGEQDVNLENKFISEEDILITRERHRQHLLQCVDHLNNFSDKK